ncbi:MAG TPA: hypothetical protein VGO60_17430 [Iamia sp.]|jgi:hypothetical protein|nr:hypothetical protein [Iamia sp.]
MLGGLGIGLVVIAVIIAIQGWTSEGAAPFVLGGAVLVLVAVFHDRITEMTVEVGGATVGVLLEVVKRQTGAAAVEELSRLEVIDLVAAYEYVHTALAADGPPVPTVNPEVRLVLKVALQDDLIDRAEDKARSTPIAPHRSDLERALRGQSAAGRAIALGVARAHPEVVGIDTVMFGVTHSLSGNEQYHALRLLRDKAEDVPWWRKGAVLQAMQHQWIQSDSDRRDVADDIVARLEGAAG